MISYCRACHKPIVWVRMKSGKSMPADPELLTICKEGAQLFILPDGRTITGHKMTENEDEESQVIGRGYVPHWATCPLASNFKRGKK